MLKHTESSFSLDIYDEIKINKLVRGKIDFEGFLLWYNSLCQAEQCTLITELYELAYQAGFKNNNIFYKDALKDAHLDDDNPLVIKTMSFSFDLDGLEDWLIQLNHTERLTVFKLCVYIFGKIESNVYKNETKENCNHWWHRDLLDNQVVQSILDNPNYEMTAMRDDDVVKLTN